MLQTFIVNLFLFDRNVRNKPRLNISLLIKSDTVLSENPEYAFLVPFRHKGAYKTYSAQGFLAVGLRVVR